jgi:hypothetical protein
VAGLRTSESGVQTSEPGLRNAVCCGGTPLNNRHELKTTRQRTHSN